MKRFSLILLLLSPLLLFAQNKSPYALYTSNGKKVSYKRLVKKVAAHDIVFFGELHNSAIAHWLELELTRALHEKGPLTLGAEMFEADNQAALSKYVQGNIDAKGFDSTARFWPNYKTDYKPLVDFAQAEGLHFVATNIPRRYANVVYRGGFAALDTLTAQEKAWIAPLPILFDSTIQSYQDILKMMGSHGSPRLVKAQAMKDATMAHFILKNLNEGTFLHFNGAFHSDIHEGIVWYIRQTRPELKIATISTVIQDDITKLDKASKGKADFILVVDSDMTSTY